MKTVLDFTAPWQAGAARLQHGFGEPERILQAHAHEDVPAVLEAVQQKANPNINTTIKDRYFNSACATPALVFPTLLRLAQRHLSKIGGGAEVYYDKMITELLGDVTQSYPLRLSLQDQGIFQIGYYHQKQKLFTKKEEKDNG